MTKVYPFKVYTFLLLPSADYLPEVQVFRFQASGAFLYSVFVSTAAAAAAAAASAYSYPRTTGL